MIRINIPHTIEFASPDINQKHTISHVFLGPFPATPLRLTCESKAEGIPDWDGPDDQYCVYATIFYEDGSSLFHTHLCFAPGTHDWEKKECYIRPRIGVTKIQINYFTEHKRGKVAFRNLVLEECPPRPEPDRRIVALGDSNTITSKPVLLNWCMVLSTTWADK